MRNPLLICLSMMLCSWALTACGNKGDLFLPADAQLEQEMESVSERIDVALPPVDATQAPLSEEVDGTSDTITDEEDDTDEATPAKKKP